MDQKEYKESDDGEVIYGVIIIFCKKDGESIQYLVVKNKETGNVSFVSGAQEHEDKDLIDTVHREVREELGISPDQYVVKPTTIDQKFIF